MKNKQWIYRRKTFVIRNMENPKYDRRYVYKSKFIPINKFRDRRVKAIAKQQK